MKFPVLGSIKNILTGLLAGYFLFLPSPVFAVEQPISTSISFPVTEFSNLSANLNSNNATFNFSYSGTSSSYRVDLSTYSDMSWDVYLDFGAGSGNSITVSNPIKW